MIQRSGGELVFPDGISKSPADAFSVVFSQYKNKKTQKRQLDMDEFP